MRVNRNLRQAMGSTINDRGKGVIHWIVTILRWKTLPQGRGLPKCWNWPLRGVHFRFGGYTPIKSEEMTPLSGGLLYVTSKRLLFNGQSRNTTITLKKIVDGHVYTDSLKIEKSTGKPDLFAMSSFEARYILGLVGKLKETWHWRLVAFVAEFVCPKNRNPYPRAL
jgi:hypothetical protein